MTGYKTVEEITAAFIKDGWSKNTSFTELTDAHGNTGIEIGMAKGHKYFVMDITGNIFNDRGEVAVYNIPTAHSAELSA